MKELPFWARILLTELRRAMLVMCAAIETVLKHKE